MSSSPAGPRASDPRRQHLDLLSLDGQHLDLLGLDGQLLSLRSQQLALPGDHPPLLGEGSITLSDGRNQLLDARLGRDSRHQRHIDHANHLRGKTQTPDTHTLPQTTDNSSAHAEDLNSYHP
ncbi:hypothetical protein [Georgenia yuyongxinii]